MLTLEDNWYFVGQKYRDDRDTVPVPAIRTRYVYYHNARRAIGRTTEECNKSGRKRRETTRRRRVRADFFAVIYIRLTASLAETLNAERGIFVYAYFFNIPFFGSVAAARVSGSAGKKVARTWSRADDGFDLCWMYYSREYNIQFHTVFILSIGSKPCWVKREAKLIVIFFFFLRP